MNQRKKSDWGGNIVAFITVILVNGLANSIPIGGQTTGEVSAKYPSLFTPAGFTFSIWSLIYLGLLVYVVYQALPAQRSNPALARISSLFIINCLTNAAWIFAWHYEHLFLSLLLILGVLATLVRIYKLLGSEGALTLPGHVWCVHLPFSLYTGWITVAAIANISVVQTAMDWNNIALSAVGWTLVKLAITGTIAAAVGLRRGDVAFTLVIAWAALGISVKQAATPAVAGAATTLALMTVMLAGLVIARKLFKP